MKAVMIGRAKTMDKQRLLQFACDIIAQTLTVYVGWSWILGASFPIWKILVFYPTAYVIQQIVHFSFRNKKEYEKMVKLIKGDDNG